MSKEVILYDLPSKGHCACWSLNPWKTRAALNFKGIPYTTEWTEYPDIEAKFKSFGIQANDPSHNSWAYSIPAVKLPDGKYLMDSQPIAHALEKLKASPSLHLDNGYLDKTQNAVMGALMPLAAELMPKVPINLLNPSSAEYFEATREKAFGMPLAELAKSEKAGENAWKAAEPGIAGLKKLLAENKGPYVAGEQVSYADLILGGFWVFLKKVETKTFDRFMSQDPSFSEHWKSVSQYFDREDH